MIDTIGISHEANVFSGREEMFLTGRVTVNSLSELRAVTMRQKAKGDRTLSSHNLCHSSKKREIAGRYIRHHISDPPKDKKAVQWAPEQQLAEQQAFLVPAAPADWLMLVGLGRSLSGRLYSRCDLQLDHLSVALMPSS